jgi:hypothetical protein
MTVADFASSEMKQFLQNWKLLNQVKTIAAARRDNCT